LIFEPKSKPSHSTGNVQNFKIGNHVKGVYEENKSGSETDSENKRKASNQKKQKQRVTFDKRQLGNSSSTPQSD